MRNGLEVLAHAHDYLWERIVRDNELQDIDASILVYAKMEEVYHEDLNRRSGLVELSKIRVRT